MKAATGLLPAAATLIATIDWTQILVALITLAGVIFNSLIGLFLYWHLRTPSGTRIGKQVENTHHAALAAVYRLDAAKLALEKRLDSEYADD